MTGWLDKVPGADEVKILTRFGYKALRSTFHAFQLVSTNTAGVQPAASSLTNNNNDSKYHVPNLP